jgi:uncharacterized membrane protein HdeD (DUF308 family)
MTIPIAVWFWMTAIFLFWISTSFSDMFGGLLWVGVLSGVIGVILAWRGDDL